MEATESAATGAVAPSSHRREGSPGAQRGSASRQHRRLLFAVQRTNAGQPSAAAAAAAAGIVHRVYGGVSLDGGRALSKRHLRPRMSALTRLRPRRQSQEMNFLSGICSAVYLLSRGPKKHFDELLVS